MVALATATCQILASERLQQVCQCKQAPAASPAAYTVPDMLDVAFISGLRCEQVAEGTFETSSTPCTPCLASLTTCATSTKSICNVLAHALTVDGVLYMHMPGVDTSMDVECTTVDGVANIARFKGPFDWTKQLHKLNMEYFGNRSFRPQQEAIINASVSGDDVFVLKPTGERVWCLYRGPEGQGTDAQRPCTWIMRYLLLVLMSP